jgi:TetR/AcrR family transcriptional regulator
MQTAKSNSKKEILETSISLFARDGFNGVSMRSIAKEVGLNVATIYHHFQDKQTLYITAMARAFARRAEILSAALETNVSPEQRLAQFTVAFCKLVHDDPDFGKLIQREILAGDAERLRLLAERVFKEFFTSLLALCRELAPDYDPHLLAVSILGLMSYHYQITPFRRHQLGSKPEHNDPQVVARHVTRLLLQGIKGQPEVHRHP